MLLKVVNGRVIWQQDIKNQSVKGDKQSHDEQHFDEFEPTEWNVYDGTSGRRIDEIDVIANEESEESDEMEIAETHHFRPLFRFRAKNSANNTFARS